MNILFDDDIPLLYDDGDDVPLLYDDSIVKEPIIFMVSVPVDKEKSIFDDTSPLFKNNVYNAFLSNMRKKIATRLDILPASVVIQDVPFSCSQVFSPVVVFDVSIKVLKEKSIFNNTSALFKNKNYNDFISKMKKDVSILPASLSVKPLSKNASIDLVMFQFEKDRSVFNNAEGLFKNKAYEAFLSNMRNKIASVVDVPPASVVIEEVPSSCSKVFSPVSQVKVPSVVDSGSFFSCSSSFASSSCSKVPSVKVPTIVAPKSVMKDVLEEDVLASVRRKVKERRALKKEEEEKVFVVVIEPVSQEDLDTIENYTQNMLDDIMGQYDDVVDDVNILEEVINDVFEEVFEIEEEVVVIVPVKTKNPVGRPRKYPVPLENAVKKPVGRPRKVQTLDLNIVKNPVGRPRKVKVPVPEAQIEIIIPPEIEPVLDEIDEYVDDYDANRGSIENYLRLIAEANKPPPPPIVIVPAITAKLVFEDEGERDNVSVEQVNKFAKVNLKKAVIAPPVDADAPPVFKAFLIYEDEDNPPPIVPIELKEGEVAPPVIPPPIDPYGDELAPPPPRFLVEEKQIMLYQVPYKIRNAKFNKKFNVEDKNKAFVLQPVVQRSAFQLVENRKGRGKVVSKDDMNINAPVSSRMRYVRKALMKNAGRADQNRDFRTFKKEQDELQKQKAEARKRKDINSGKLAYM